MTLNFPAITSAPYIDPTTGLKYIYNNSIGAWESAIQPPVIISDSPPGVNIPGFLYWDRQEGQLYVLYNDGNSSQWVVTNPSLNTRPVKEDSVPPIDGAPGDLWFDTTTLRLLYLYFDGVDSTWISVSSSGVFARNTIGPIPPSSPSVGDFWWNSTEGRLFVFYDDGSDTQWVDSSGPYTNNGSGSLNITSNDSSILITSPGGPNNVNIEVNVDLLPILP